MSRRKLNFPPTPAELRRLAKKAVAGNPIYLPEEPSVVGSAENLRDDRESETATAPRLEFNEASGQAQMRVESD